MFSKSTVKYIQSLQHKKFRDEYNSFIAEGPKVVGELIISNQFSCRKIYATAEWISQADNLKAIDKSKIIEVKDFELEKMSGLKTFNKVIGEFEKKQIKQLQLKNRITLVLDDIQDPGNFGTIIRTAHWFGVEQIVCSTNTVDMYNPKVVQSTMASLGMVNITYTDLSKLLHEHPSIASFAAVLHGTDIKKVQKVKEALLIIGNESKGISEDLLKLATEKVTIPQTGSAESLNAAVATGILLYALTANGTG